MVKLVVQVKLQPTPEQAASLTATVRRTNAACDWLSGRAWDAQVFRQFALHKLVYREARETFADLSSQMVVRSIAKVADAYKIDKKAKRRFRALGSIAYDARILSCTGTSLKWLRAIEMISKAPPFRAGLITRSSSLQFLGQFVLHAILTVERETRHERHSVLAGVCSGPVLAIVRCAVMGTFTCLVAYFDAVAHDGLLVGSRHSQSQHFLAPTSFILPHVLLRHGASWRPTPPVAVGTLGVCHVPPSKPCTRLEAYAAAVEAAPPHAGQRASGTYVGSVL